MLLQLRVEIPSLAATYWSIFFAKESLLRNDPFVCSQACILLACKAKAIRLRVQEVYLVSHHLRNSIGGEIHAPSNPDYWGGKKYLILMELALLRVLQFRTQFDTVHSLVLLFAREIELSPAEAHLAFYFANDSFCSSVGLLYPPHVVACACVSIAMDFHQNPSLLFTTNKTYPLMSFQPPRAPKSSKQETNESEKTSISEIDTAKTGEHHFLQKKEELLLKAQSGSKTKPNDGTNESNIKSHYKSVVTSGTKTLTLGVEKKEEIHSKGFRKQDIPKERSHRKTHLSSLDNTLENSSSMRFLVQASNLGIVSDMLPQYFNCAQAEVADAKRRILRLYSPELSVPLLLSRPPKPAFFVQRVEQDGFTEENLVKSGGVTTPLNSSSIAETTLRSRDMAKSILEARDSVDDVTQLSSLRSSGASKFGSDREKQSLVSGKTERVSNNATDVYERFQPDLSRKKGVNMDASVLNKPSIQDSYNEGVQQPSSQRRPITAFLGLLEEEAGFRRLATLLENGMSEDTFDDMILFNELDDVVFVAQPAKRKKSSKARQAAGTSKRNER